MSTSASKPPTIARDRSQSHPSGIGQVGLGQITEVHRDGYRRAGLRVVAGTDVSADVRRKVAGEEPGLEVCESLDALLECAEVALFDVAAPHHPGIRRPLLERLIPCGKPILLQKPFAQCYADALSYTEMAERAGVTLMINQNSIFTVGSLECAGGIVDGTLIGKPFWGRICKTCYSDPGAHPWYGKGRRWWFTDMAVHEIALLHHFVGPPDEVYCRMGNDPGQAGVEGDGFVQGIFLYPDGLAVLIDEGGIYTGPANSPFALELQGAAGGFSLQTGRQAVISRRDRTKSQITGDYRWFPEAFGFAMHHLIYCMERNSTPWASSKDNLYVMGAIEAAYVSSAEKRPVHLKEIMGERWVPSYGPGYLRGDITWSAPRPFDCRLLREYPRATP